MFEYLREATLKMWLSTLPFIEPEVLLAFLSPELRVLTEKGVFPCDCFCGHMGPVHNRSVVFFGTQCLPNHVYHCEDCQDFARDQAIQVTKYFLPLFFSATMNWRYYHMKEIFELASPKETLLGEDIKLLSGPPSNVIAADFEKKIPVSCVQRMVKIPRTERINDCVRCGKLSTFTFFWKYHDEKIFQKKPIRSCHRRRCISFAKAKLRRSLPKIIAETAFRMQNQENQA